MGRYKVGDKVRVREWDDMLKERGGNDHTISCTCIFVDCMKPLCGKVFTVTEMKNDYSYRLDGEAWSWAFSDDMLYPAITYREYMKENFPDLVSGDFLAGVYCCPSDRGFRDYSCTSQCGTTYKQCVECWDQYMTEAEYKKYVLKEEEKEMDYKVGDIVKIVKAERSEDTPWVPEMDKYVGRAGVVRRLDEDSCRIEGLGDWWFPHKDLEPATPKDILAPFCTVKTRSGNIGLFDGKKRVLFSGSFMDIGKHSKTLESGYADDCDIVEIYKPNTGAAYSIYRLLTERGECIWKREEVVEITAEEAAKKLSEQYPGQTVKIIV